MRIATTILQLQSKRRLVALVGVLAILLGVGIGYNLTSFPPKSRQYAVGTSSTRVLVDTPSSQIVAVNPAGLELLSVRANLLASLMVNGPIKTLIAQQAGLRPEQLYGIAQSAPSPVTSPTPPAQAFVLTTAVLSDTDVSNPGGSELPVIDISTQAPSAAGAARLADAAVAGLQQYIKSEGAAEGLPTSQRIRVSSFAVPQGVESMRGPGTSEVLLIVIVAFVVGCALIVLIPRLKSDSRRVPDGAAVHEFIPPARWAGGTVHEFDPGRRAWAAGVVAESGPALGDREGRAVRESDHGRAESTRGAVRGVDQLRDVQQHRGDDHGPDATAAGGEKLHGLRPFSAALRAVRGTQESGL
jgi:hypothetical protein